jgi:predicted glutamine amidotransferase
MCRLLGWAATAPTTLAELLGDEDLDDFTSLSRKHGDGWGAAWCAEEDIAVRKSPAAAVASREYADWTRHEHADLAVVHLRWATLGLDVVPENTHPFVGTSAAGPVAFAHNGSVRPPSSLDPMLTPEQQRAMQGTTDSERYFRAVLSEAGDGDLGRALAATVEQIATTLDFTSLNCLLMTPDTLYAVSRFGPNHDEEEDYFHLRYRVTDDAVVVASTGWGRNWQPVANGEMLTVRRETLEVSVVSLQDVLIPS